MPVTSVVFGDRFQRKHIVLEYENPELPGEAHARYMERLRHGMVPNVITPRPAQINAANPRDIYRIGNNTPSTSIIVSTRMSKIEFERRILNTINQNNAPSIGRLDICVYLPCVIFQSALDLNRVDRHEAGSVSLGGEITQDGPGAWTYTIDHLAGVRPGGTTPGGGTPHLMDAG